MSNWFTYLIRTPIAQIRADFREYKQLESEVAFAKNKRDEAYNKLVFVYLEKAGVFTARPQACITHVFPDLPGVERPIKEVCRAYMPGIPCPNDCCSCLKPNHAHSLAVKLYDKKLGRYNEFWKNKFNQR